MNRRNIARPLPKGDPSEGDARDKQGAGGQQVGGLLHLEGVGHSRGSTVLPGAYLSSCQEPKMTRLAAVQHSVCNISRRTRGAVQKKFYQAVS